MYCSQLMLTIGTVLFNEEKRIHVIEQNVKELIKHGIHCILVDNASTDSTLKCLKKLVKENSIELVSRTTNHMAKARNEVLQRASTEWVGFIDADCRISVGG